jgi:peptide/nickel transport system ATP-binding protein
MYFGRIVELAPARLLFGAPRHPYTRLLLDSAPVPGKRHIHSEAEPAELPNPYEPPPGCAFAARCARATGQCTRAVPGLDSVDDSESLAACYHPL